MYDIVQIVCRPASNILALVHRVGPNFGVRKMKSILDRNFRYSNSVETDLRKTFSRARREIRRLEQARSAASAEVSMKVLQIPARSSVPRVSVKQA